MIAPPTKSRTILPVFFPSRFVLVLALRQQSGVLRLAWRKKLSAIPLQHLVSGAIKGTQEGITAWANEVGSAYLCADVNIQRLLRIALPRNRKISL